ncbi:hypothetical protein KA107_01870 [Candidatus Pacearchaeota archaeon]|nr:hypothetical protein [Candidatus Pacearchaeota archaeon]
MGLVNKLVVGGLVVAGTLVLAETFSESYRANRAFYISNGLGVIVGSYFTSARPFRRFMKKYVEEPVIRAACNAHYPT